MAVIIGFLASFLIWLLFAGLIVLWFIDGRIKREQVVHALIASFIAWTLAEILKRVFMTPRPFDLHDLETLTISVPSDPGFPSAHTATVFALAFTVWLHDKKVGFGFVLLAFLVGIARVGANVHFPIDILGGAIVGTTVALVVEKLHLGG